MAQLICIVCPKGCHLTVDEQTLKVTGNSCEKGEQYGKAELTAPTRVVTSTVCVQGGTQRRCPVKTNGAIPKGDIRTAMHTLDTICLHTPVYTGDVVVSDVCGTGIAFVATKDIL